jgi:hypothetical protein
MGISSGSVPTKDSITNDEQDNQRLLELHAQIDHLTYLMEHILDYLKIIVGEQC